MSTSLYWPMMALIAWTTCIGYLAILKRVREIRTRRIPLQSLASPRGVAAALVDTQAMDNFNNLLQVPLLFYLWCLSSSQFSIIGLYVLLMAWAYVALRILHSAIQITHNRVMQRFVVWVLSDVLLILLWGWFVMRLMQNQR